MPISSPVLSPEFSGIYPRKLFNSDLSTEAPAEYQNSQPVMSAIHCCTSGMKLGGTKCKLSWSDS